MLWYIAGIEGAQEEAQGLRGTVDELSACAACCSAAGDGVLLGTAPRAVVSRSVASCFLFVCFKQLFQVQSWPLGKAGLKTPSDRP